MSVKVYKDGKLQQVAGNADTRLTKDDITSILGYTPASSDGSNSSGKWGIDITGNASTSTKLQTARKINGVEFDGSTDINIVDDASYQIAQNCRMEGAGWYRIMLTSGTTRYHGIIEITRNWGSSLPPETLLLDISLSGDAVGGDFKIKELSHEGNVHITKIRYVSTEASPYANDAYIDIYYDSSKSSNTLVMVYDNKKNRGFNINSELSSTNATLNIVSEELEEGYVSTVIELPQGSYFNKSKIDELTVGSISGVNYAGSSSAGGDAANALKLNGYSLSTAGTSDVWGTIPSIGHSDGVMEIGKYIDFHATAGSTVDYDVRISADTTGLTISGTTRGTFSGSLSGNASTATKLATSRTLTIGSTGKSFNGTADMSWSLSEIGAAPSSHTHSYLPLTGGTLTGEICLPMTQTADKDSTVSLPVSSGAMTISDITKLSGYRTYLGSMTLNGAWNNIISIRHRNGVNDGTIYGMYIRSSLTSAGNLIWGKQYGTWQAERTILDSSNYNSYAVPTITSFQTFAGAGWYRIALIDKVNTCTSFILSIDRDYNVNNNESHTFLINYSHYLCRIVELNAAINSRLFTDIRFVVNNDGAAHQSPAYIDLYYNSSSSNNAILTISRNIGRCDWRFQTATISEIPSGYTAFTFSTASKSGSKFNKVEVDDSIEFTNSGTSFRGVAGTCSANDYWRVGGAGTADDNAGYMELATADDATEPIYVRQYSGAFATLKRTLTLLDGSGNTDLPGTLRMSGVPALASESSSQTIYMSAGTTESTSSVLSLGTNSTMYYKSTTLRGNYIFFNPYVSVSSSKAIGTASDEKVKTFSDDIQTDEEKLVKLFDLIKPKSYNYNYSHSDNLNIGFSAQDIEKAMLELGIDPEKYGILNIRYNHMLSRGDSLEDSKFYTKFYEISYNDLFSLSLLKMNVMEKQHVTRLESLEERLTALENK